MNFAEGGITTANLSAPEILEVTYWEGFGLDITLAQDQVSDGGIYGNIDKLLFSGVANDTETPITVPASSIEMLANSPNTANDGSTIYNNITFNVPVSSLTGFDSLSELKVYYDLNNDASGSSGADLMSTVTLVDVARPDIITDFTVGEDKIEVEGALIDAIEWAASSVDATDTVVRIASSGSELLLLDNFDANTLSASDFTFV